MIYNEMDSYTGKTFNPMKICEDDICIEDIAHSLALMCRGSGQLLYFYSVAQHSLNCAYEAMARGYDKKHILACLLHDASEGYIADIIRPVKRHLKDYYVIEEMIMDVIFQKYHLNDIDKKLWREIDNDMLENELKVMLKNHENDKVPLLKSNPDFHEKNYKEVEQKFLCLANKLINEVKII